MCVTQDAALAEAQGDPAGARRENPVLPRAHRRELPARMSCRRWCISVKLKRLDDWTAGRQRNARLLRRCLQRAQLDAVQTRTPPRVRHIYNQYVIRARERDALRGVPHRRRRGARRSTTRCRCICSSASRIPRVQARRLSAIRTAAAETLALPIYPELTEVQLNTSSTQSAAFIGFSRSASCQSRTRPVAHAGVDGSEHPRRASRGGAGAGVVRARS